MVCPVPMKYPDEDLDVGPLNQYWLLIKFIMASPGDIMETFEVRRCIKEDGVVYIKDKEGNEDVGTLSRKYNDAWNFLLDMSPAVYFKAFCDCLPKASELGRQPYYWETYRIVFLAVKICNEMILDQIPRGMSVGWLFLQTTLI